MQPSVSECFLHEYKSPQQRKMFADSLAFVTQGHRRWDLPPLSNSMTKCSFNCTETQGLFFIVTAKAYTAVNPFGLIPSSS